MKAAAVVAVAGVLALPPLGAAASASVDAVTLPGLSQGPIRSKTWQASVGGAFMKRVKLDLPLAAFNVDALEQLAETEGILVGEAAISHFNGSDAGSVLSGVPLETGRCAGDLSPDSTYGHWHLWSAGSPFCRPIRLRAGETPERLVATADVATASTRGGGIVSLQLTVTNVSIATGTLLADNPPDPVAADTDLTVVPCATYDEFVPCGDDGPPLEAHVREVVGGQTGASIRFRTRSVLYGTKVVFSGRVFRGEEPSGGERVLVGPYWRRQTLPTFGGNEGARTTTDAEGRFRVAVRLRHSARWGVWAQKGAADGKPKLNTLARVPRGPIYVRAPRPPIRIERVRHVSGNRTRARIVVTNPLRWDTLTCTLRVGGRTFTKRNPYSRRITFTVTGPTGARVQARVYNRHPDSSGDWIDPDIAPGWSRVLRLP